MENLKKLIELKTQIEELKDKFEFQKTVALDEALEYKANNDKSKINLESGSVTVRFKTVKPTVDTDGDLFNIQHDIEMEQARLLIINAAGIDALTAQLEDIQVQLSKLQSSKRLKALQTEFKARQDSLAELVPELAVSLK